MPIRWHVFASLIALLKLCHKCAHPFRSHFAVISQIYTPAKLRNCEMELRRGFHFAVIFAVIFAVNFADIHTCENAKMRKCTSPDFEIATQLAS